MHALTTPCTAFAGTRRVASGPLEHVATKAKELVDQGERAPMLIFDDGTSEPIELDFRGTAADVLSRLARMESTGTGSASEAEGPRGPGRPKLGVVAREVTLLPRHWDWLNAQPGGASVALRKLVEAARRANEGKDRVRGAQEATYRFMSAMAGNEPGFEEAARALFANDQRRFDDMTESWPIDVRNHSRKLASVAFAKPVAA